MKAVIRKHSWWVWLLVIIMVWSVLAIGTPKVDRLDLRPTAPVISAR